MIVAILQFINKDKSNLRNEDIYKSISYIEKPHKVVIIRHYENDDYKIDYDKYYENKDNVFIFHNKVGNGTFIHLYLYDYFLLKAEATHYLTCEDDFRFTKDINRLLAELDNEDHINNHIRLLSGEFVNLLAKGLNRNYDELIVGGISKLSIFDNADFLWTGNGFIIKSGEYIDVLNFIKNIYHKTGLTGRKLFKYLREKYFNEAVQSDSFELLMAYDYLFPFYFIRKYKKIKFIKADEIVHEVGSKGSQDVIRNSRRDTYGGFYKLWERLLSTDMFEMMIKSYDINKDKINKLKEFLRN